MNKALVYVLRPMFAEEPGLLQYMGEKGICEEISVEDYEGGNWTLTLERVWRTRGEGSTVDVAEGSIEVAKLIGILLD